MSVARSSASTAARRAEQFGGVAVFVGDVAVGVADDEEAFGAAEDREQLVGVVGVHSIGEYVALLDVEARAVGVGTADLSIARYGPNGSGESTMMWVRRSTVSRRQKNSCWAASWHGETGPRTTTSRRRRTSAASCRTSSCADQPTTLFSCGDEAEHEHDEDGDDRGERRRRRPVAVPDRRDRHHREVDEVEEALSVAAPQLSSSAEPMRRRRCRSPAPGGARPPASTSGTRPRTG